VAQLGPNSHRVEQGNIPLEKMGQGAEQKRSQMMSRIRSKNTKPELNLRRQLFSLGFRYRLHSAKLPGSPDIVLAKNKAVIFVHGWFWHRHNDCAYTTNPKSNEDFWLKKFNQNIKRDRKNRDDLIDLGWRVGLVWECALRNSVERTSEKVKEWLNTDECFLDLGINDLVTGP